jgi:hypothetical protein
MAPDALTRQVAAGPAAGEGGIQRRDAGADAGDLIVGSPQRPQRADMALVIGGNQRRPAIRMVSLSRPRFVPEVPSGADCVLILFSLRER